MNPLIAIPSFLDFREESVAHFVQQEREADLRPAQR
jgi:hypothetical protein